MEDKEYLIYCHISPSGKKYIGQTKNYNRRCIDHKYRKRKGCPAFFNAIQKYGWDSFTHIILKDNLTIDEANKLEEYFIKEYNTLAPNGYNLQTGGKNSKPCSLVVQRDQFGEKNKSAKAYEIIDPFGNKTKVCGTLKYFCKSNGLSYDLMLRVANPNYKATSSRGYSCKEISMHIIEENMPYEDIAIVKVDV